MKKKYGIIEIGSNNTKTHIYENNKIIYEDNTTIEFKKNYKEKILSSDLNKLYKIIEKGLEHTQNIHIYGCSIFRTIPNKEVEDINSILYDKYKLKIEVVSQDDEAYYTALGCYAKLDYNKTICIFIGGGGSIELIFTKNKKIINNKYYNFGVVDITNKFSSLKEDIPKVTFEKVSNYIDNLINDIDIKADILILAGGDHLYWYNNAQYELLNNELYSIENQKYMITRKLSDQYDKNAFVTSLDKIRQNSDNPQWFDGSRAMKVITNLISHKINAQYIIPTKINMEDGIRQKLNN